MVMEVIGDVLGYSDEIEGDVMGVDAAPVAAPRGAMIRLKKPGWRGGQLAPGVMAPGEGMVPLPLVGLQGAPAGQFTSALSQITFEGRLQKPFRAERLLVSSVRTGATSVGRLLGQIFVGTDLQQAEITGFDIELVGPATAFGTRLTLKQAPPGVSIRIIVNLSSVLTNPDTIFASILFMGRVVH